MTSDEGRMRAKIAQIVILSEAKDHLATLATRTRLCFTEMEHPMFHSDFYVYIMSNEWLTIYVGVTNDLERRVHEHKSGQQKGFTKRHSIDRLVYFEQFTDIRFAIAREKEIKGWKRFKKVALIRSQNPEWKDLNLR